MGILIHIAGGYLIDSGKLSLTEQGSTAVVRFTPIRVARGSNLVQ
jgi:hypothetical protein